MRRKIVKLEIMHDSQIFFLVDPDFWHKVKNFVSKNSISYVYHLVQNRY